MAQLPPKIPTMSPTWPSFSHQRTASAMAAALPWADDFLDLPLAKHGGHRSASDSAAFFEMPLVTEDCQGKQDFDRLDEDQLMSMFDDDVSLSSPVPGVSSSNPSTPSDHNSINEEKAVAASDQQSEEAQSFCKGEAHVPTPAPATDAVVQDPKRVKRILANRQSAQRSRVRKMQYISELERSVTSLQTEVSALSPRVALLDHQRSVLTVGNSALKQRIAALMQDKIFKDAHQAALRKEIERLRQVCHQQSLKKMATATPTSTSDLATVCPEKELLS